MNKIRKTGVALAMGAAAMFAIAPAFATSMGSQMVHCKGVNACKGHGKCGQNGCKSHGKCGQNGCKGHHHCKTAHHACKGHHHCKGKGIVMMTKKQCLKSGGKIVHVTHPHH